MAFEIPKRYLDEQVKIKNLDELKEKLWINLPDWIEEFDKPITIAKHELVDLRQQILTKGTPESLILIRDFIQDSQKEIVDSTKEAMDSFQKNISPKEKNERTNKW